MKHKKGFAAVLLTLIISALLSVSALPPLTAFLMCRRHLRFMKASLTLPGRALLTVRETAGMHRTHRLRCANGQQ